VKCFVHAFEGIIQAVKAERNMRIHICAAAYVLIFALIAEFSSVEVCIVLLCTTLVIAAELINSSLEQLADEVNSAFSERIRIAKDMAARAVLVCAAAAFCIGLVLFLRVNVVSTVANFLCENIVFAILLLLSVPFAVWFIAAAERKNKKDKR